MKLGELKIETLMLIFPSISIDVDTESGDALNEALSNLKADPNYCDYLSAMTGAINRCFTNLESKGVLPLRYTTFSSADFAAAIISDTVMFKSPTCTIRDIRTAERMARYANISLNELGKKIFSASFEGKTVKELLFTDYKEFHIAGHSLAVSQITCMDSDRLLKRKDEFLESMK